MITNEPDPKTIVYFKNRYMPLGEAQVGILTHALNYGTGVFEGIRGYWNAEEESVMLVRPLDHYERWKQNARIPNIEIPAAADALCEITAELCVRNAFTNDIYVRPLAFKSAQRVGVSPDETDAFAIVAMPFGVYLDSEKGLHAGVSAWRRVEDNAIPGRAKICGAYGNSALATADAKRSGFDEAIFLSENGHVAEGATCNIFMVRGGKLITPGASDNILEGITRASVMTLAHDMGVPVVERSIDRSELYIADEIFFTGTAVELAPVTKVDHRLVGDGTIGPLTRSLREMYHEAVRGKVRMYRHWVQPAPVHEVALR